MITRFSINFVNLNIDIFYSPLTDRDIFWVWVCKVWLHLCQYLLMSFFYLVCENVCNLDENTLECWYCIISVSLFFRVTSAADQTSMDHKYVNQLAVSYGRVSLQIVSTTGRNVFLLDIDVQRVVTPSLSWVVTYRLVLLMEYLRHQRLLRQSKALGYCRCSRRHPTCDFCWICRRRGSGRIYLCRSCLTLVQIDRYVHVCLVRTALGFVYLSISWAGCCLFKSSVDEISTIW